MQLLRGTERARDTGGGGWAGPGLSGFFQPPPPSLHSSLHPIPLSCSCYRSTRSAEARGSSSQLICGRNQQGVCSRKCRQAHRSCFFSILLALSNILAIFIEIPYSHAWKVNCDLYMTSITKLKLQRTFLMVNMISPSIWGTSLGLQQGLRASTPVLFNYHFPLLLGTKVMGIVIDKCRDRVSTRKSAKCRRIFSVACNAITHTSHFGGLNLWNI